MAWQGRLDVTLHLHLVAPTLPSEGKLEKRGRKESEKERWLGWWGNLVFLPEPLVVLLCSYSVAPSFKGFSLLIAIVHY